MKKRLTSWLLVLTMIVSLIPSTLITASAADVTGINDAVSFNSTGVATINKDGKYILEGQQGAKVIRITDNANVTLLLKNAEMTSPTSPIQVTSGAKLTLIIDDSTNNIIGCSASGITTGEGGNEGVTAGIYVADGATLTIDTPDNGTGNGKLTVTGGYGGAGIGGKAGTGTIQGTAATSGKQGETTYPVDKNVASDTNKDRMPKGGAGGAGGQTGNSAESAGTINILNGTVSATGGYGGAGIGGGMGAKGGTGATGTVGDNGDSGKMTAGVGVDAPNKTSSWDGDWGGAGGGAGGNGGTGGVGGAASTINISGGTVNAVAGERAAAIGGGAGGPGGEPGKGGTGGHDVYRDRPNTQILQSVLGYKVWKYDPTWDQTKGPNYQRVGWTDWGNAPTGRYTWNSNAANNYLSWLYVGGLGGDGGTGADGQNGRGGVGGNGGNITISGGAVKTTTTTDGAVKIGGGLNGADNTTARADKTAGNAGDIPPVVGNQIMYRDHQRNYQNWAYGFSYGGSNIWILTATGWTGGTGGEAGAQDAVQANGQASEITIDGASNADASAWSDIVDEKTGQLTNGITGVKNPDGDALYRYVLTVTRADNKTEVEGATVTVRNVKGTNGDYTFTAKTGADGKAQLWLPVGNYELVAQDVKHPTEGWMVDTKPFTFAVENRYNQAGAVSIGPNFTLTADITNKVYFKTDSENPVKLKIDATTIGHTIEAVDWFVEPIKKGDSTNSTIYDTKKDTDSGTEIFIDGYNAAKAKNEDYVGSITISKDQKEFELPIHENGRYWVQVKYRTSDTQGLTALVVNGLQIDYIYREYPVYVRQYISEGVTANQNEFISADTKYQPLPTSEGLAQNIRYGFAWDLNGYTAQGDQNPNNLLPEALAPSDTIKLYPRTKYYTWYKARLVGANKEFASNEVHKEDGSTVSNDYVPVQLTLNKNFLDIGNNNNNKCDTVDGKKDPSKYTIRYSAREGIQDVVFVYGLDKNKGTNTNKDTDNLYSHVRTYLAAVEQDTINAINYPDYKLVGVKVEYSDEEEEKELNKDEAGNPVSVTISDIHGLHTGKKVKSVSFLYEYNMTDVTIKALYTGTDTPVKEFTVYKTPMEIGTKVTYAAPEITGFNCDSSTLDTDGTYKVVKDGEIIFYYTKKTGNVTYKAVDETGATIWTKDGTVGKGDAPDTNILPNNTNDAVLLSKYERKADDTAKIVNAKGDTVATYDGVNDLTVTYTYQRKTRDITIKQIDHTTGNTIGNSTTMAAQKVGEYVTVTAPATPDGYTPTSNGTQLVYVNPDNNVPLEAKFYYKESDEAQITIKLYASENDKTNGTPFNTMTLKSVYGQKQTVEAPTVTGWKLKQGQDESVVLTPKKNDAASRVAEFVYDAVYDKIKVTLKGVDTADLPDGWTNNSKNFDVQQGQGFTITAPSLVNYKLANGEALEKSLTADDIKANRKTIEFTYEKAEAELITITVEGVKDGQTLYSYTKDVKKSANNVEIQVFTLAGYKLDNVKMGTTEVNAQNGTYTIDPAGTAQTVTATYSDNMVDVTINGYLKGTTSPLFNSFTVKAEAGKAFTYAQPSLIGYDTVAPINNTIDAVKTGDSITFYYTKSSGNVTYKAQDEKGKELAVKTVAVDKNGTIDKSTTKANELFTIPYYQVRDEGVVTTKATDNTKYDGVNDVTVTYTYEKIKKTVTIEKYDQATGKKIKGVADQVTTALATGETHTVTLTNVDGYTSLDNGSVNIFVKNAENQTVKVYYKQSTEAFITVEQVCGGVTLNTYQIPAQYDVETTIKAPTMQGYNAPADTKFTATKGDANKVILNYTLDAWEVKVKLVDQTGKEITVDGFEKTYQVKKGDSFSIAAPSINDYSLVSTDLVVTRDATELETEANRTITFKYDKTENVDYVTHTIRGVYKDNGNAELFNYTVLVAKDATDENAVATYYAPTWANLTPAALVQTAKKNETKTVTFEYSSNLATVTVEHVGRDGQKLTEGGITDVELDGYTVTGKATTIAAPALDNYVCVGAYTTSVQEGKLTQDVTLAAGSNTVKFVYEKIADSDVVFKLVDKDTNHIINYIKGAIGTTYAPAQTNNALNLSSINYKFVADANASSPFKPNEAASLAVADGMKGEYVVYYVREKRNVTYKFMDVTGGEAAASEIQDVTNGNETSARIGEKFKATAPVIDGYTVVGSATFNEVVEAGTGDLVITFNYRQKDSKEVTVNHKVTDTSGEVLFTYTMSASVGEWVTAKSHDFGGKYTLTSDAEQKIRVTNGENTIEFFYAPNFVTVSAFTNTDGQNDQSYGTPVTAAKKTGETVKLNPPSLNGFVLSGIKVDNDGSETIYAQGWDKNTNTLTLTLSEQSNDNVKVTYYYKEIKDVIPDYQATLTIKAQYNGYELAADRTQIVTKGKDATVIPGTYAGYTVKQYKLGGVVSPAKDVTENEKLNGITVNVNADTTLIFTYDRTDNTVVIPGKDNVIGGGDDIIVKPGKDNPDQKPGTDKDGNIKVPDGGTVILPDGTEVTPPGGSVVKPDGTIVVPGTDGSTDTDKGATEIDPTKPNTLPNGWFVVAYDLMGGKGTLPLQIVKQGETATVLNPADYGITAPTDRSFKSWNDNVNGNGTERAVGTQISNDMVTDTANKTLTLFAQWKGKAPADSKYHAVVHFNSNNVDGQTMADQVLASETNKTIKEKLTENTMTLAGWTFAGWNTKPDGTGTAYADGGVITVEGSENKDQPTEITLYAQWVKKNADGSITVPGADNKPGTDKDVTANGNGTKNPELNPDGTITIPAGGSVTKPDGTVIELPNGGTLKPDGSISITLPNKPGGSGGGSIEIDKDGNTSTTQPGKSVVTITYDINNGTNGTNGTKQVFVVKGETFNAANADLFQWSGHKFIGWTHTKNTDPVEVETYAAGQEITAENHMTLLAQWVDISNKDKDGTIVLPGTDGSTGGDKDDNVSVKPAPGGNLEGPDDNGNVKVPDNSTGTVVRPNPDGGKEEIEVPGGTTVKPDGSIVLPGGGGTIKPGDKIDENTQLTGYSVVIFEKGEGTGDTVKKIVKNGNINLPAQNLFTAPANKTFSGWKTGEEIKGAGAEYNVTANVTFTAQFEKSVVSTTATVVFDYAGGMLNDQSAYQTSGKTDTLITANGTIAQPERSGYEFKGWKDAQGADVTLATAKFGEPGSITVYTAKWEAKEFTVTFDAAAGTLDGSNSVNKAFNATLTDNEIPTAKQKGFQFIGWNDGNSTYTAESIKRYKVTGTVTFTAQYTKVDDSIASAVFIYNGGISGKETHQTITGKTGDLITGVTEPTREGYTFKCWTPSFTAGQSTFGANGTVAVYTAEWDLIEKATHTVKFEIAAADAGKGTMTDGATQSVKDGETLENAPTVNVKDAKKFQFVGWTDENGVLFAASSITLYPITGNKTFTAKFEAVQESSKTSVTFDYDGGKFDGKYSKTIFGEPTDKLGELPTPTREGYTFNNWNEQITKDTEFGAESKTYTAQWTAIEYTIHYNGSGATGNVADQKYTFETANATLAQNGFTSEGKTFQGWSLTANADSADFKAGASVNSDIRNALVKSNDNSITLYAVWADNQVNPNPPAESNAIVIFDFAGGKDANGNSSISKTGTAGATVSITAPTREGYTFNGWDKDAKFGAAGSVTVINAKWTIKQYTVTFEAGTNGTIQAGVDTTAQVDYNSSIEAGKVPTITAKTGYVFIGWENNGNVYTNEAVASFKVTGNVTFTARYENISKAIAIFDYNGGKDADGKNSITMTGIAGEEITVKAPTREGYTFAGWDKTDLKYGVAGSVTVFTAQWTANKHEVTFVVGDDTKGEMTGEASVQVDHNGSVEANKVPTITAKTGYVFIGWSDGTSTYAADAIKNYKVTADVTFTAQYEADSKAVVIFDFNGGKDADNKNSISMSGDANAAIDNMAEPSRDGYTFAGWKNGEQDVANLVFGAAGTVTVYTAQWTVNKHTVTFNAGNNGSMNGNASVEVDHNGSVAAEKVPTITANEGFVFVGWSDGNSTYAAEAIKNYKVTGNVTFTAQYEEVASKAFAIFDYAGGKDNDGKSSIMMTGTAGAAITIAAPTRAGYTFAGWKNGETTNQNPTFGAAGSVTTYTAAWTADPDKTFKVNFVVDATKGDVTGTTEFDVASGKFLTEVPTVNGKDGYTFIGWSDGKNTYYTSGVKLCAITGNTTFTAQFTKVDPVNPDPSKKTLTITSNSDTVLPGKQVQFKALLNGTETNDVTWTVKGGTTDTTISESGVLTVGSTEANGTKLTITATSKTDTGLTAEKTIIVTAMPVKKPDGSVVIPGGDGKIDPDNNKKDDITIKPNPKPDGGDGGATVNPDGTVTLPDGGTVVRPNPDGNGKDETIKVPGGSTVDPDGTIHFMYTVTHKYSNGTVIRTENVKVKEGESHTFQADNISGYTADPSSVTVKGGDRNYNIVITYNKNTSGGGSTGGGGSSGGGSSSGGSGSGSSTKPSQPDTKPTPGTKPNDPTQTGIANWLRTDKHTTSMTGYGNGLFGPEDKVTRAQVAQIFYRLLKDNNVKITVNFTDVPDDAWYATAVNTLGSLGIVGGIGDGRFDPNRPITRAEFCVIATRFAKVVSTVENPFSDINAQDWYYTAVTTAASYDWVTGMGDGTFRPYDVITRAQAATIINRMLGAAADRAFVDKYVPNPYKDVSTTHWAYYQIIEASVAHDHGYDAEGVEIWNSLK